MWKRKVVANIYSEDGDYSQIIEGLRIDFEYTNYITMGLGADSGTVTIYNLNNENIKTLLNTKKLYITLHAGYEDSGGIRDHNISTPYPNVDRNSSGSKTNKTNYNYSLPVLFEGIITNVWSRKDYTEQITTLFCIPKSSLHKAQPLGFTEAASDMTLYEAIELLVNGVGFTKFTTIGLDYSDLQQIVPTRLYYDTCINEIEKLGTEYNFYAVFAPAEVRIISTINEFSAMEYMARNTEVVTLERLHVKSTPSIGFATIIIPYALNASLLAGSIVDATTLVGSVDESGNRNPDATGDVGGINSETVHRDDEVFRWAVSTYYQLEKVEHRGSTHTNEFMSILFGRKPTAGDRGDDESFFSKYKRTSWD